MGDENIELLFTQDHLVRGEEPDPTGGEHLCEEHSRSKEVNLEKQSPILQYEHCAYRMNGSGCVSVFNGTLWDTRRFPRCISLTKHGGSVWWT